MLQSALLILFIIGLFWGFAHIRRQPPALKRRLLWRSILGASIAILIALAVTGRMHWLFALIGALLPFVRGLFGIGIQLLPLWLRRRQQQSEPQNEEKKYSPVPSTAMDTREALDILGLEGEAAKGDINSQMVIDAHRRLIQKMHPDRGGSDYLAAKINQARDFLLARVKE